MMLTSQFCKQETSGNNMATFANNCEKVGKSRDNKWDTTYLTIWKDENIKAFRAALWFPEHYLQYDSVLIYTLTSVSDWKYKYSYQLWSQTFLFHPHIIFINYSKNTLPINSFHSNVVK